MKKIISLLILTFSFIILTGINLSAMSLGFNLGLSTPNNEINNVYNSNKLLSTSGLLDTWREGTKLGYHIGVRGRIGLSDNIDFVPGIALHMFPVTEIKIPPDSLITITQMKQTIIKTKQNIVPISAGVNFYILKKFIGIYGIGEITYNYIFSSVTVQKGDIDIPVATSNPNPSNNRVGVGLGAGFDLDIKLVTLNAEARYNIANLIGQTSEEKTKSYVTFSLGVFF